MILSILTRRYFAIILVVDDTEPDDEAGKEAEDRVAMMTADLEDFVFLFFFGGGSLQWGKFMIRNLAWSGYSSFARIHHNVIDDVGKVQKGRRKFD